jgi:CRISPR-associated endonuclease/helicase Cas3
MTVEAARDFASHFELLTGHPPFPWQQALFAEFVERRFPRSCDIPTGLGKTSVMPIWLLGLADHAQAGAPAGYPRRLVYVVNRRTVVDQATEEAEQMRTRLVAEPGLRAVADAIRSLGVRGSDAPLAISSLRGQFADNAEWRSDPARPAVIVGTVDMIGSRLLFSGYGCGFKSRPFHAGLLGQDALLLHDEAHLEPAFQELISAIESEQERCCDFGRVRVMALTATSRADSGHFGLSDAERDAGGVAKRIKAKKGLSLHPVDDEKQVPERVADLALSHKDGGEAILVFLRKLEDLEKVAGRLRKATPAVQTLTGTMRGYERDALAKDDAVFARFLPKPRAAPHHGTVYLVCTSAGEVGVNISADHLVCDLTPFDSMTQRFGRVNRFGQGDARIDVVHGKASEAPSAPPEGAHGDPPPSGSNAAAAGGKSTDPFEQACRRTLDLLRRLPTRRDGRHDASPGALGGLPAVDRREAFTPEPTILTATDILFDAWALTSIREKLPGRPPVADWLHGVAEWEPPEAQVAWREEVGLITGDLLQRYRPEDLLEDYPLKPHELLRDRADRVFGHLEAIAERHPDLPAWVVEPEGVVATLSLSELVEKDGRNQPTRNLADCVVLLPPAAGGLERTSGTLAGRVASDETAHYDVAEEWREQDGRPRRQRVWDDAPVPNGMRLVRTIDLCVGADDNLSEDDETVARRYWRWYVLPRSADDDGSRTASQRQELAAHLESAEAAALGITARLGLKQPEATAVVLAARWHDRGKNRRIWQRAIGNLDYPRHVLAKSGGKMRMAHLNNYRHELGSLLEVPDEPAFRQLSAGAQDLVLHLIAAHHGRARPHFPMDETFDPGKPDLVAMGAAREAPRRFARLQRKYGRWGLAYLESLLRAADALASESTPSGAAAAAGGST